MSVPLLLKDFAALHSITYNSLFTEVYPSKRNMMLAQQFIGKSLTYILDDRTDDNTYKTNLCEWVNDARTFNYVELMWSLGLEHSTFKRFPLLKNEKNWTTFCADPLQIELRTTAPFGASTELWDFVNNGDDGNDLRRLFALTDLTVCQEDRVNFAASLGASLIDATRVETADDMLVFLGKTARLESIQQVVDAATYIGRSDALCAKFPELRRLYRPCPKKTAYGARTSILKPYNIKLHPTMTIREYMAAENDTIETLQRLMAILDFTPHDRLVRLHNAVCEALTRGCGFFFVGNPMSALATLLQSSLPLSVLVTIVRTEVGLEDFFYRFPDLANFKPLVEYPRPNYVSRPYVSSSSRSVGEEHAFSDRRVVVAPIEPARNVKKQCTPADWPDALEIQRSAVPDPFAALVNMSPASIVEMLTKLSHASAQSLAVEAPLPPKNDAAPEECCICLDAKPVVAVVSCGHVCLCEACVPTAKQKETCPICGVKWQSFMKLFK